jgi:Protein of unknown function (DUF1566)
MKLSLNSSFHGLRACGLALLLALAPSVWAQCVYFDAFKDNGDGTVTDPRSNTVWQRCALGQRWNGSGCDGEVKEIRWWDAMRAAKAERLAGKTDWRLPTKAELESITSKDDECKKKSPSRAVSTQFYKVWNSGYMGVFWSSSPYVGDANEAWVVGFNDGNSEGDARHGPGFVRLVRAGQSLGIGEFNREFAKIGQYEAAYAAQLRKQEKEAASNAANVARNNSQACGRLYAGKPVRMNVHSWFGGSHKAVGVIVGVGNGQASGRIISDGGQPLGHGLEVGRILEYPCNYFE